MTDKDYTHVAMIVDRSGSMHEPSDPPRTKAEDATSGVHAFVEEQRKQPGKITFSLTQFNTTRQTVTSFSDGRDLLPSKTEDLEDMGWVCEPTGGTALLDAIGHVIKTTGDRLEKMPEHARPGKVIVLIWTDGKENSSVKFKWFEGGPAKIASLIAHQRDRYGWQFVYMGIGEEAYLSAPDMGFREGEAVLVAAAFTQDSYQATNESVSRYRGGQSANVSYTAGVRTHLAGK